MKKYPLTDVLFILQLILATIFGTAQALKMFSSVQGMTMVLFVCFQVYIGFNLILSYRAHRKLRTRKTIQVLIMYGTWTVLMSSHLMVFALKGTWTTTDTKMMVVIALTSFTVILVGKFYKGLSVTDPMIQGTLALVCKAIPQFYLAYCIYAAGGGNGLSSITVWVGHVTIYIRIAMLVMSGRESKWNRNVVGSLMSEIGNEISWMFVTAVWLCH